MALPDEIERGYRNAAARAADIAHPIFAANGWSYSRGFGEDERRWVPSWADLYGRILGHVRTVGDEGNILSSSGRITVTRSDLGITIHLDLSRCEPRMPTMDVAEAPAAEQEGE